MDNVINLDKLLEDKFFAQEQAIVDALLDLFTDNGAVAETVLIAAAIYLGLWGGEGRMKAWHATLTEFIATGRTIRAGWEEAEE